MKATIEFNLPEEKPEWEACVNSFDYQCCLSDIDNYCRNMIKHGGVSEATEAALSHIRDIIPEL